MLLAFPRCSRQGSREGGVKPPRPRHCDRGRNPRLTTGCTQRVAAGKVRGVGRSESQETCPGAHLDRSSREDPGMSSLFILGGARSGKSRHAIAAQPAHGRVTFVATAEGRDGDMAARIARHRAERPSHWTTIEEPFEVSARLGALRAVHGVSVDCVTVWVANRMLRGDSDETTLAAVNERARL